MRDGSDRPLPTAATRGRKQLIKTVGRGFLDGELWDALLRGSVWWSIVVSAESGKGIDSPATAHSRSRACSIAFPHTADLGLTPAGKTGRLNGTGTSMISSGRAPVSHAGAAKEIPGVALWTGTDSDKSHRALEYGFCL